MVGAVVSAMTNGRGAFLVAGSEVTRSRKRALVILIERY